MKAKYSEARLPPGAGGHRIQAGAVRLHFRAWFALGQVQVHVASGIYCRRICTGHRSCGCSCSLVLGYYENGKLRYAGRAGTGYSHEEALSLHHTLSQMKDQRPSFSNTVSRVAAKGVTWICPEPVAEVEYRGRTTDGLLRQAAFIGLREDKSAAAIILEQPQNIPQHRSSKKAARFPYSHPERICGRTSTSPSRISVTTM